MISPSKTFHFQKEFEIMSFQINPEGKLRWAALGDLMQEIAWKHADSRDFGKQLFDKGLVWILSRLEIKLNALPSWGEKTIGKTSGRGIDKLFGLRDFSMENIHGEVLVQATSAWLLLDMKSKRPQRPDHILPPDLFKPLPDSSLTPPKVVSPDDIQFQYDVQVKPSDLDMNNHVNNVSYIRWIEDFCALKGIKANGMTINYMAEVLLGELVSIFFQETETGDRSVIIGRHQEKLVFSCELRSNG